MTHRRTYSCPQLRPERHFLPILLLLLLHVTPALCADEDPIAPLRTFYTHYLDHLAQNNTQDSPPDLALSSRFHADITTNAHVCALYATGVCGWQADGDAYLDTQEIDPHLTTGNSGLKFEQLAENHVAVTLNVYPSAEVEGQQNWYNRRIIYKMIRENGKWVADDIMYSASGSSRMALRKEAAYYLEHPDPDSEILGGKIHE